MKWFVEKGCAKVVAYLAMLEPSAKKRSQMATDVVCASKDKKTAQLLVDLGGVIQGKLTLPWSCKNDLELLSFFVEHGALLHAGIDDYKKWDADIKERQRRFGGNWYSGNNEGVNPNLHPVFRTPLERLLVIDVGPYGQIVSPFEGPNRLNFHRQVCT